MGNFDRLFSRKCQCNSLWNHQEVIFHSTCHMFKKRNIYMGNISDIHEEMWQLKRGFFTGRNFIWCTHVHVSRETLCYTIREYSQCWNNLSAGIVNNILIWKENGEFLEHDDNARSGEEFMVCSLADYVVKVGCIWYGCNI